MSRRRIALVYLAAALLFPLCSIEGQASTAPRVRAIRFWSFADVTRVAIQTDGEYKLRSDQIDKPPRLFFDLNGLRPPASGHRGVETIQVADQRIKEIRVAQVNPGTTRIVFDLESPAEFVSSQLVNPDRLMIEIRPKGTQIAALSVTRSITGSREADVPLPAPPAVSTTPHVDSPPPGVSAVIDAKTDRSRAPAPQPAVQTPGTSAPQQTAMNVPPSLPATNAATNKAPAQASAAKRDNLGDRSLVRVFGLKLGKVVIDAGHGGHDTGTIGPGGLLEKDLVLDVALRLGQLVQERLGSEVVYTRNDDTFIPLETRTAIANEHQADLFVSVHANSSQDPSARGVETYYLNFTSNPEALEVAARENAVSEKSIHELQDLVKKITLKEKIEESRELASDVQLSLYAGLSAKSPTLRNRGVKKAPFVVLIGANMPSILAEISFVSNPEDEKKLATSDYRQKIAESLYKGIAKYAGGLSGVKVAAKFNKEAGQ